MEEVIKNYNRTKKRHICLSNWLKRFPYQKYLCRFTTTWRVPLVKQEQLTLPEHLISSSVIQSLIFGRVFIFTVYLSVCLYSFGLCIVYLSSIYSVWLPPLYLQTFITMHGIMERNRLQNYIIFKKSLKMPKGNQNPYIEEQTIQWPKEQVQEDKQRFTKHTYKTEDRVTWTPLKLCDG